MTTRKRVRSRAPTVRHPGQVLEEDWLLPFSITQTRLAKHLGISKDALNILVRGRRSVSPKMAWMLAQTFGTTPEYWLKLQASFDLAICRRKPRVKPLRLSPTQGVTT